VHIHYQSAGKGSTKRRVPELLSFGFAGIKGVGHGGFVRPVARSSAREGNIGIGKRGQTEENVEREVPHADRKTKMDRS